MMMAMMATIALGAAHEAFAQKPLLRITVLFNNVPYRPGLVQGEGFSCLAEGLEKTILFDTGANGRVLLDNMRRLAVDPQEIASVFLSHMHGDHTGGLEALIAGRPGVEVIVPAEFPAAYRQALAGRGAEVTTVTAGGRLMDRVYSTGGLGRNGIVEQSMIVETPRGLVVITGCAHPGIVRIAKTAERLTGKKIHLLMGGFHLGRASQMHIQTIISRLQSMGVQKVAPSHCTGERAVEMFRQAWGEDFMEAGLGAVIELPLR